MIKQNSEREPCKAIEGLTEYNERYRTAVKPCLLEISKNYCSYCDKHSYDDGDFDVEHFKGKAENQFLGLQAEYSNLFAVCHICNIRKKRKYPTIEPFPFKPDDQDYCFEENFYFDTKDCKLIALNDKAKVTLNYLNLNREALVKARKQFCKDWIREIFVQFNDKTVYIKKKGERPSLSYRFIELKIN